MPKKITRFQPLSWADNIQALKLTGSDIRTVFIVKDLYAGFTATEKTAQSWPSQSMRRHRRSIVNPKKALAANSSVFKGEKRRRLDKQ